MSGSSVSRMNVADSSAKTPIELHWRSWPLADGAPWAWIVLLAFPLTVALAWQVADNVLLGVAVATFLAVSLRSFLFPVQYELGASGIMQHTMRGSHFIPWSAVGNYQLRPQGIFVFHSSEHEPLETLRGLYIPWNNQEQQVRRLFLWHLGFSPESVK